MNNTTTSTDTMPADVTPAHATPAATGVHPVWRVLTLALAIVLLLAWAFTDSLYEQLKAQIHHLEKRLQDVPQVRDIAVLVDEAQKPGLLVTYDPVTKTLQVQRLSDVKEGREESLHLWALSPTDKPRLLGVLTSRYKTTQLDAPPEALDGANALGLSVESKDKGPANGQPYQPWVFKGWLVKKAI